MVEIVREALSNQARSQPLPMVLEEEDEGAIDYQPSYSALRGTKRQRSSSLDDSDSSSSDEGNPKKRYRRRGTTPL